MTMAGRVDEILDHRKGDQAGGGRKVRGIVSQQTRTAVQGGSLQLRQARAVVSNVWYICLKQLGGVSKEQLVLLSPAIKQGTRSSILQRALPFTNPQNRYEGPSRATA